MLFFSLREPQKRLCRLTDGRYFGQSSGFCKYAPPSAQRFSVRTVGPGHKAELLAPQRCHAEGKELFALASYRLVHNNWTFYWLPRSKRTRVDELSWGYGARGGSCRCFYRSDNDPSCGPHPLPHPPPTTRFTHQITQAAASPPARPRRRGPRPRCRTRSNPQVKTAPPLMAGRQRSPPAGADSRFLCPQGTACGLGARLRHPSHLTTSLL